MVKKVKRNRNKSISELKSFGIVENIEHSDCGVKVGIMTKVLEEDGVYSPSHYGGDTEYEQIKVMRVWLTHEEFVGACKFNIHTYLARARKKGQYLKDLEKTQFYVRALNVAEKQGPLDLTMPFEQLYPMLQELVAR